MARPRLTPVWSPRRLPVPAEPEAAWHDHHPRPEGRAAPPRVVPPPAPVPRVRVWVGVEATGEPWRVDHVGRRVVLVVATRQHRIHQAEQPGLRIVRWAREPATVAEGFAVPAGVPLEPSEVERRPRPGGQHHPLARGVLDHERLAAAPPLRLVFPATMDLLIV